MMNKLELIGAIKKKQFILLIVAYMLLLTGVLRLQLCMTLQKCIQGNFGG
ncbi:hypothetical protein RchiOBHm_Chr5g0040741 [Rosa chinensis]|uniref:Uncharacterized protein n=1 Tax=Rosa chinensis TaxID=74649 RepID=A0A2P6Q9Q5_ROSCH|nr:hypothetical protein RchiOBHm_Chr5g0029801 [Rosa chinensis]PRQ31922.1 hypothetical protein RchiOBHm_Chr5g0040741 [Rosa chinensis]